MALAPVNPTVLSTARALFGYGAKSAALAFMADGIIPHVESVCGVPTPRADLDLLLSYI